MRKSEKCSFTAYKGDYRPVSAYKNAKKLFGYKTTGMSDREGSFEGTYNDHLTLYGKCGHRESKNLCPTPLSSKYSYEVDGGSYSLQITRNLDGTFNFSGAMVTGYTIATVTLSAGTYSASGCELVEILCAENGENYTLPCSFTLEKESTIYCVLRYTGTEELYLENQYIQIEKGSEITDFSPYCGDPLKPPAPDNIRPIVEAEGSVLTRGKNLLDLSRIFGTTVTANGGTLICGADGGITGSGIPTNTIAFSDLPKLYLPKGTYTLSRSGVFENIACAAYVRDAEGKNIFSFGVNSQSNAVSKTINLNDYPEYSYLIFEIKRSNNDIEMSGTAYFQFEAGSTATEYNMYLGEHSILAPNLYGLEVDADTPYNYAEIVDGEAKYYIADSFSGNTLNKRIGKIELDGSENWVKQTHPNDQMSLFVMALDEAKSLKYSICSHFGRVDEVNNSNISGVFSNNVSEVYNFGFLVSGAEISDLEKWKEWLKEQYDAGCPVTVYYILAKPYIEIHNNVSVETGEITPVVAKTFPRFTNITVIPNENKLCYGMQKCIKII